MRPIISNATICFSTGRHSQPQDGERRIIDPLISVGLGRRSAASHVTALPRRDQHAVRRPTRWRHCQSRCCHGCCHGSMACHVEPSAGLCRQGARKCQYTKPDDGGQIDTAVVRAARVGAWLDVRGRRSRSEAESGHVASLTPRLPDRHPTARVHRLVRAEDSYGARALQVLLDRTCEVEIWSQGLFEPGGFTISSLIKSRDRAVLRIISDSRC